MERKKVGKHTACDALFALLLSHDNNKAARNNMPLEGPGTGLSNPNIYWDPVSAKSRIVKLHWIYIVWLGLTAAKLAEDKESHHSPGLYNLGTRPHYEIFQDRPLSPLLRSYQKVEPYRAGEGCVSQIICFVLHLSISFPSLIFTFVMTTCEPQLFECLKKLPPSFNNYLTVWRIRKKKKPKHYGILLRRFCMISCHILFSSTVKGLLYLKSNWRKFTFCPAQCFRRCVADVTMVIGTDGVICS